MVAQDISCPNCHQIDAVQKVTAIVGGETHRTTGTETTSMRSTFSGKQEMYASQGWSKEKVGQGEISASGYTHGSSTVSVTQQSTLAKTLTPPVQPKPPSEPQFGAPFSAMTGGGCLAIIGMVAAFVAVVSFGADLDVFRNLGAALLLILAVIVASIVGGIIFYVVGSIAAGSKYPDDVKGKMLSDYRAQLDDYQKNRLPRWQRAMQRWDSMFYCRRCDVIYVPGDHVTPVPPERVIDLSYHNT